jgi:hypothetical protein
MFVTIQFANTEDQQIRVKNVQPCASWTRSLTPAMSLNEYGTSHYHSFAGGRLS